ncbi:MAG: mechanosensitive ion channel family protein, partial [Verrucomicrobiota bacterium]
IGKADGVADDKEPQVGIENFGDSSIDIGYRYWVRTKNYYSIKYAVNLEIFKALKAAGVGIPFPQREVRILGKEE